MVRAVVLKHKLRIMSSATIEDRLEAYIAERGETKNSFAAKVGINPSNFNRKMKREGEKGKLSFSNRDFALIHSATGLSPEWLRTGEGEMMSSVGAVSVNKDGDDKKPFYDVDFALGFASMYNDTPNVPSKYVSAPGYEKADFWCRTSGDSMQPLINGGDMIALKEVADWQDFMPMNEVYAVMTTNDLRTVKVVRKGTDDTRLTLHAYNDEYEDQEISKASIAKVFKVLGVLKTL